MLRFNRVKGQAIMAKALKANLKAANQYDSFCKFLNRIYKEGISCFMLSLQSDLFLQSLISFVLMNPGVIAEGSSDLLLALAQRKKQSAVSFLSTFLGGFCDNGDLYLNFADKILVAVTTEVVAEA